MVLNVRFLLTIEGFVALTFHFVELKRNWKQGKNLLSCQLPKYAVLITYYVQLCNYLEIKLVCIR